MKRFGVWALLTTSLIATCFLQTLQGQDAQKAVLRGWISDEGCASGRASSGICTGTNPDCAKKCVRDGKKMVLVDPDHKRLLDISNPHAAMERVGDYVEV